MGYSLKIQTGGWGHGISRGIKKKECGNSIQSLKKSHTSEEGGAHFRISFSHLLMNLENK